MFFLHCGQAVRNDLHPCNLLTLLLVGLASETSEILVKTSRFYASYIILHKLHNLNVLQTMHNSFIILRPFCIIYLKFGALLMSILILIKTKRTHNSQHFFRIKS